jgi:hypothetical protein
MVFKKDLTPIGRRGTITKHRGKGATEQRVPRGGQDSVSGLPSFDRATNRYPKPAPAPVAPVPMPAATSRIPLPPEE